MTSCFMIGFAVIVVVMGALGAVDPIPQSETIQDEGLPLDLMMTIASRILPGPDRVNFALASKMTHNALRGLLRADRAYRRVLICLTATGEDDGNWLSLFANVLDGLQMPPLPADFPPTLLAAIQDKLKKAPQISPNAFVDGIRALHPPEFRGLFPHNLLVANALLRHQDCLSHLRSPDVIAQLHAFGIVFPMRFLLRHFTFIDSFKPYACTNELPSRPYQLMVVFHEYGLYEQLLDLLRNPLYLKHNTDRNHGVTKGLSLLIPTISVDLFGQIIHLPTVRPFVNDPRCNVYIHPCLMVDAVRAGRIDDIASLLVSETDTICPSYSKNRNSMAVDLPMTRSAIRAYVALRRHPRFRTFFEDDREYFFYILYELFPPDMLPDLLQPLDEVGAVLADGLRDRDTSYRPE